MKILTKLYLVTFLVFAVGYFFIHSLMYIFFDVTIDLWSHVFSIVLVGGASTLGIMIAHKQAVRRQKYTHPTEADFNVHQSESVYTDMSIQNIYDVLKNNDKTNKWKLTIDNSIITGKTKRSKGSWGEKIKIENHDGLIKIESSPLLRIAIFDNGRNLYNVNLIRNLIEKE